MLWYAIYFSFMFLYGSCSYWSPKLLRRMSLIFSASFVMLGYRAMHPKSPAKMSPLAWSTWLFKPTCWRIPFPVVISSYIPKRKKAMAMRPFSSSAFVVKPKSLFESGLEDPLGSRRLCNPFFGGSSIFLSSLFLLLRTTFRIVGVEWNFVGVVGLFRKLLTLDCERQSAIAKMMVAHFIVVKVVNERCVWALWIASRASVATYASWMVRTSLTTRNVLMAGPLLYCHPWRICLWNSEGLLTRQQ